jgi:tetratricopeptide (TPR) repeat protein
LGEYEEAWQLYRESIAIKREIGDRRGLAYSLNNLGYLGWLVGNYETVEADVKECLTIFRDIGDRKGVSFALTNLGNLAQGRQEYQRAQQLYEESLAVSRELDYKIGMAYALNHLGTNFLELAENEMALRYFREALTAALAVKATPVVLEILVEVAALLVADQQWDLASRLLATILAQPAARKNVTEKAKTLLASIKGPIVEPVSLDALASEILRQP